MLVCLFQMNLSRMRWTIVLAFVTWTATCASGINVSNPITPDDYAAYIAGKGFSTRYFKTWTPLDEYSTQNVIDLVDNGFDNLRLRCNASRHDVTNETMFDSFLSDLEQIVDDLLVNNATPIISWLNQQAEACAAERDRVNYVSWWTGVANRLKHKNYRLSFNLFTEIGREKICYSSNSNEENIRFNIDKYTQWTVDAKEAIRNSGGNNENRIIILTAPGKEARSLPDINSTIYADDDYLLAEWHLYASGPNKKEGSRKYWSGDGSEEDKQRAIDSVTPAVEWTNETGIPTIQGAWMARDNKKGSLNQSEVEAFGKYYATLLKSHGIPWCMNSIDDFYDTANSEWITEIQTFQGASLNMSQLLEEIKTVY